MKIISFEGIDGTGKTTQINLLKDALTAKGYKVNVRSYPVYDSFFGTEIGKHLAGKDSKYNIDPRSMALWFAMDRWKDRKDFIATHPNTDILLLNRYTLSAMVYQSIRAGESDDLMKWIEELEHEVLELPRPDLYLIFDLPFELALKNNEGKGKREYIDGEVDKYEKDKQLQTTARKLYSKFGLEQQHAVIIECFEKDKMLPVESIFHKVKSEVSKIIKLD
jgi:dTMP kinase